MAIKVERGKDPERTPPRPPAHFVPHPWSQVELLSLEPRLLSFLQEALLTAEGDDLPVARDRTKMLGMHVRGISLEVVGSRWCQVVMQNIYVLAAVVCFIRVQFSGFNVTAIFSLVQVRLRVACIQLLCNAMGIEGLKLPQNIELRNRMIACFFKSLTVRWEEVSHNPKSVSRLTSILMFYASPPFTSSPHSPHQCRSSSSHVRLSPT